MKKCNLLLASLFCLGALRAHAQLFSPSPGISSTQLYSTSGGTTVSGVTTDSTGNLYFEVSDPTGAVSVDQLARNVNSSTGFASTPTVLFQDSTAVSSGLVKVYDNELFFSDTSDYSSYSLRTINLRNFTVPAQPLNQTSLPATTTVSDLFDLAVRSSDFNSGNALTAYISANPSGSDNEVFKLNLSTGVTTAVVDTGGDYSGPIAFDHSNRLIYGRTGSDYNSPKKPGGLFAYSASEINNVTTTPLPLDAGHELTDNYANSFLAMGSGNYLFQAESHFYDDDLLHAYDLANGNTQLLLGSTTGASLDFSGLASSTGNTLFAVITDFSNYPPSGSTILAIVVPEPSSVLLAGLVTLGWIGTHRRRRPR